MPRSTTGVNDQSTEPVCWHVLGFGDCCCSEGLVKEQGHPQAGWGNSLNGTTWKHQQSWRGHRVPKASSRHQSQGLLGLNELSRQVSVRSVSDSITVPFQRWDRGTVTPRWLFAVGTDRSQWQKGVNHQQLFRDIQLCVF